MFYLWPFRSAETSFFHSPGLLFVCDPDATTRKLRQCRRVFLFEKRLVTAKVDKVNERDYSVQSDFHRLYQVRFRAESGCGRFVRACA